MWAYNFLRFLAHPSVLQYVVLLVRESWFGGKQIGLTKSENAVTGLSNFKSTVVLPSTGDFIIPIILRSCCQGEELESLTVPNLADHSAFDWLKINFIKFTFFQKFTFFTSISKKIKVKYIKIKKIFHI